jgi:ABC-type transporter Mla MlaB component
LFSFAEGGDQAQAGEKTVFLNGQVSESEVREAKLLLATFIESNASNCSTIKIDVSGIENVSSVIVAILLSGLRAAKKYSCHLSYINLPEYLFNMAKVGGVEDILLGKVSP